MRETSIFEQARIDRDRKAVMPKNLETLLRRINAGEVPCVGCHGRRPAVLLRGVTRQDSRPLCRTCALDDTVTRETAAQRRRLRAIRLR
jgi:hypothetical protein